MAVTDFAAWLTSHAGTSVALTLAFVLGSMVGSFLNVVAHRVPRGETVVYGRSHCPTCGRTIRARDNLPIIGWLALRGRCRDCGAPISARYPFVEASCGALATLLAAGELVAVHGGVDAGAALVAWVGRTAAAMTAVAWALLAFRGHRVSRRTVAVAVALTGLAAACLPALRPLPLGCATETASTTPGWTVGLVTSLVGLSAGLLMGGGPGSASRAACTLVGAALGWQAALVAAVAAATGRTVGRRDAAGCLATVTAVAGWRCLAWVCASTCRVCGGG